jgi:replicative DNA helicase
LTKAVNRIIELNAIFNPRHIYVDRGFGEVQVELLHQKGVNNPETGLREKVKGIAFGESVEVRDPYTKLMVKKEMKPFMVDNLRQFLEREKIVFPESDEELYLQLISYIVVRKTQTGRPIFEAGGTAMDHVHDALMLALLSITQNYGELNRVSYTTDTRSFSNNFFMPKSASTKDADPKDMQEQKHMKTGRAANLSATKFTKKRSTVKIARKIF